ncbi:MAG: hypothetical protein V4463_05360 [Pseudomonadota bacterium]
MALASDDIETCLTPIARRSLRDIVADHQYAMTFQTLGQYRAALLQHIANFEAAELAANSKSNKEET